EAFVVSGLVLPLNFDKTAHLVVRKTAPNGWTHPISDLPAWDNPELAGSDCMIQGLKESVLQFLIADHTPLFLEKSAVDALVLWKARLADNEAATAKVRAEDAPSIVDERVDGLVVEKIRPNVLKRGEEHPVRNGNHTDEAIRLGEGDVAQDEAGVK